MLFNIHHVPDKLISFGNKINFVKPNVIIITAPT